MNRSTVEQWYTNASQEDRDLLHKAFSVTTFDDLWSATGELDFRTMLAFHRSMPRLVASLRESHA